MSLAELWQRVYHHVDPHIPPDAAFGLQAIPIGAAFDNTLHLVNEHRLETASAALSILIVILNARKRVGNVPVSVAMTSTFIAS
jgi:hypothetical protein